MRKDDPAEEPNQKASENGQQHSKKSLDLPGEYGENRVVLLPVTPTKVFAFWETAPGSATNHNRQDEAGREDQALLRLRESGGSATESGQKEAVFEMPVGPRTGSRYVNLRQAGKSYQAELGYAGKEGLFRQAAQSNVAETPRPLPPPEKTISHQPTDGPGRQPSAPDPSTQPRLPSGLMPEGESRPANPESEALLIKRRLAIFRHLSEAVPLLQAGHAFAAEQAAQAGPGLLPREKDLTAISELKFMAGISSR